MSRVLAFLSHADEFQSNHMYAMSASASAMLRQVSSGFVNVLKARGYLIEIHEAAFHQFR